MKKRLLAVVLSAVMVLSCTACDNGNGGATGGNNGGTAGVSGDTTQGNAGGDTPAADGSIDLTMWCIATESDSNRHAYETAIEEVSAAHPEINFTWEATENEAYKTKIKAAAQADEMPDIFFTWSCAFLGDFVANDKVYCLDDAYSAYRSGISDTMLGNVTYDGKVYGVPTTMNIVGFFANMEILEAAGYTEVPATYDELIACCDDLVAQGYIPFGCSGSETWCVTEYLESIIEKNIGAAALNDIFFGNTTWNNEGVAEAVDIFQEMINKGYFDPSGDALTNDEVKANFMAGKYAFYMNGTWNCADFNNDAEFGPKVQVAEFPVIDSSASSLGQLIGGPSDTLAVAANGAHPAEAAVFAIELGRAICHYGYLDGCGLPAWNVDYDDSTVNALTQSVAEIVANANGLVLFGDTAQSADDAQTYLSYVDSVYGCELNGAEFIEGLAADIR